MQRIAELLGEWETSRIAIGFCLLTAIFVLLWLFFRKKSRVEESLDYASKPFMNEFEWTFYAALMEAVKREFYVFAQVALYALVQHKCRAAWPRIAQKSCDFVLISKETGEAVLVIEIDGKQHQTSGKQRQRDNEKDAALTSAGIPILRIPAQKRYDPIHLTSQIRSVLNG